MPTFTPRLGLEIPLLDENLTDLPNNWNKLDKGFSGVLWVTPGTTPDSSALFDGLLVAELGNGIVWKARRNQAGGFDKVYIKYPWVMSATTTSTWGLQSTSPTPYGIWDYDAAGSLNADAGLLSNGTLTLPFKGLYNWNTYVRWENDGGGSGQRSVSMALNSINNNGEYEVVRPVTGLNGNQVCMNMRGSSLYNAGTTMQLRAWKDTAGTLNTRAHHTIALIRIVA